MKLQELTPAHRTGVRRRIGEVLFLFLLLALTMNAQATIYYVKTPGAGGADGHSGLAWNQAKATVSSAISTAGDGDQVWVAEGVYPEHIVIDEVINGTVKNVAVYGGFAGNETYLSERDFFANETILDGQGSGTVVTIGTTSIGPGGASDLTRIDGFTITNGRPAGFEDSGGGIRILSSAPVVTNNLITHNETSGGLGGGIVVEGARVVSLTLFEHPVILNNRILNNRALGIFGEGGGIALKGSDAQIIGNHIVRNQASTNGGGIAIRSSGDPRIINNVIVANTAGWPNPWTIDLSQMVSGNCWVGGGGIIAAAVDEFCEPSGSTVSPVIANNLIAANGAYQGGGVLIQQNISTALIVNNTIVANSGAGVFWEQAAIELSNNLVAFNTAGLEQSIIGTSVSLINHNNIYGNELQQKITDYIGIADATGFSGNISTEPGLVNVQSGHFHLQPDSACLDSGDNSVVAGLALAEDIEGDSRIHNGTVDIGADESLGTPWNASPRVLYVHSGGDNTDGLSWQTAINNLETAIDMAAQDLDTATLESRGSEIWVSGNSQDIHYGAFEVPSFIQLYGGFNGTETDREQRNPGLNQTILDGEGEVSVVRFGNSGYRVSRLDGFTVQHGGLYLAGNFSVDHSDYKHGMGAGILAWIGGPEIVGNLIQKNAIGSPLSVAFPTDFERGAGLAGYVSTAILEGNTLQNNEVWDNQQGIGGAIYFTQSWPTIIKNELRQNHAEYGAGLGIDGGEGFLTNAYIADNIIEQNAGYLVEAVGLTSAYGGGVWCFSCGDFEIEGNIVRNNFSNTGSGMYIASSPRGRIESNLFEKNLVEGESVFAGGGLRVLATAAPIDGGDIRVVNNTFVGHEAIIGGAISIDLAYDNVIIASNIFSDNSSGICSNTPGTPPRVLDHNLFHDNMVDYVNLSAGAHDLFTDPVFADALTSDYHLTAGSPAIEAGSPTDPPIGLFDQDLTPRIQDADHDGVAIVDIGAYEFPADFDGDLDPDWSDPDDDNDGMSDSFEACYAFLDPLDPNDAGLDQDNDGLNNLEEYLAGSLPDNPDSDADGRIDGLDSDPLLPAPNQCSGDNVVLSNAVYPSGTIFDCRAQQSIQTEGAVIVEPGADVLFMAPVISLAPGFSVTLGGAFHAVGATDVAP